ncbi:MAG: hypothetical protein OXG47_08600 [bacterium]|nr:hypothetical protein [bacterium]
MLAILDTPRASFDPGSVALALLRCFDAEGPEVLLIDADPAGSALADRFSEAMRDDFSPGLRGLPTLLAAGVEHLEATLVTDHCYHLDNPGGVSPWLMFAPSSRRGAAQAIAWLNENAEPVAALGKHFRLVVASSLKRVGSDVPVELLRRAACLLVIAPADTEADRAALADPFVETALPLPDDQRRLLLVEGKAKLSDDELDALSPLEFLGRLPAVGDTRLLMPPQRLRRVLGRLAAEVDESREPAPGAEPVEASTAKPERPKPVQPSQSADAAKPARAKGRRPRGGTKAGDDAKPARAKPVKPRRGAKAADDAKPARAKPVKPAKAGDDAKPARAKPVKPAKAGDDAKPARAKPVKPRRGAKAADDAKPARAEPVKPAKAAKPSRRAGRSKKAEPEPDPADAQRSEPSEPSGPSESRRRRGRRRGRGDGDEASIPRQDSDNPTEEV